MRVQLLADWINQPIVVQQQSLQAVATRFDKLKHNFLSGIALLYFSDCQC